MANTFPLPQPTQTQLHTVIAQRAALDYFKSSPPRMPLAVGEYDEMSYLPQTEYQMQTFKPHGWVLAAMEKARADGIAAGVQSAQEDFKPLQKALEEQIDELRKSLEKHRLVDRIREEVMSFSVNTKDVMDLVEDLARLVP